MGDLPLRAQTHIPVLSPGIYPFTSSIMYFEDIGRSGTGLYSSLQLSYNLYLPPLLAPPPPTPPMDSVNINFLHKLLIYHKYGQIIVPPHQPYYVIINILLGYDHYSYSHDLPQSKYGSEYN